MILQAEPWSVIETNYSPERLHHGETIFTIGNGYLSTRGAFEERYPDEHRATFVHGVFDDIPIVFTELANAPDWLPLEIFLDGQRFSLDSGTLNFYQRTLDLKTGLLTRRVNWTSPSGKTVNLTFERFASLANEHMLYLHCQAVADFTGVLEFRFSLDGNSENSGFAHWRCMGQGRLSNGFIFLRSRTRATGIELALAMGTHASRSPDQDVFCDTYNAPTRSLVFSAHAGEMITVEKQVAIATSRDSSDPTNLALEHLKNSPGWDQAFAAHARAWQAQWDQMDVIIEGDEDAQLAVRSSLYQLYIAAPRHDDRVNIGAKTLSGFGYRGHSFWDTETFMLPVFIYTAPQIARNLLNYRYQRLPAAREKARQNGCQGAQFPWESADTGEEVTPTWVPDQADRTQLIRIWTGDIEIHISADIAYAACLYWKATGDDDWFIDRGAEIVLDTARYWASRAEWNSQKNRYEFTDVIGPDEYHDRIDNNFYTNYMAVWNIKTAMQTIDWLHAHAPLKASELENRLELTPDSIEKWCDVINSMFLPVQPDGLIEQFEGYFQRQDVDLAALEPRTISAQLYFGIEGCSKTQVLKQPDVLMLFYMLRDQFSPAQLRVNYDYYTPRTDITYGSSLGPSIQTVMSAWLGDSQAAYKYFMIAAHADLKDARGNAGDGIHGASAGGIWQSIVFGFAGLKLLPGGWEVHPCLPARWKRLSFHFTYRGKPQIVDIHNP